MRGEPRRRDGGEDSREGEQSSCQISLFKNMKVAGYILMVLIAVAAIAFAGVIRLLSSTALYDTNLYVFRYKLDEAERAGIFHTVAQLMSFQIALLVITNVLWAVGVGVVLWRSRSRESRPLEWGQE